MSLEMNYVGTKGSNQQEAENINLPDAGPGNIQARRPYPRFGNMSIHSQARSTEYHALQTKFQKRTSNGYWYLVSHTWSQTLTTQPAPGIGGNFTYDTGPAAFDAPHLLAMSFGAELPFGRDKKFLSDAGTLANALVGGWQAQSIVNYRSGLPFTPTVSRDVANTGSRRGKGRAATQPDRVGRARQSDAGRVVRQDRVRRACGLYLRRHRARHSPRRPPVERGLLAVQAIQGEWIEVARVQG